MRIARGRNRFDLYAETSALLAMLLGMSVILGWVMGSRVLISVGSDSIAMQFNTALGFVFAGAALYWFARRRYRFAVVMSVLGLGLSTLTWVQYLLGRELGVDSLFFSPPLDEVYPGRMGFNAAVCFTLFHASILVQPLTRKRWLREPVLACIVFAFGLIATIGYISNISNLYGWSSEFSGMSIHTALGFVIIASRLFLCLKSHDGWSREHGRLLLSLPTTAAFLLSATIVIAHSLHRVEEDRVKTAMHHDGKLLSKLVQVQLESFASASAFQASSFVPPYFDSQRIAWRNAAHKLIDMDPSIELVAILDQHGSFVDRVDPMLMIDQQRVIQRANTQFRQSYREPGSSQFLMVPKFEGRQYLLIGTCIRSGGYPNEHEPPIEHSAYWQQITLVNLTELVQSLQGQSHSLCNVEIIQGTLADRSVYTYERIPLGLRDTGWELVLIPSDSFFELYTDSWANASLCVGLLVTVTISLLVRSTQSNQRSLVTQRQLLNERSFERTAIDEHAIVVTTDPNGRIIYANSRFCEISGYSLDELVGQTHRIVNSGTHPKEFFSDLWKTIAQGEIWQGTICNRAKDGRLYWVSTTIVPFRSVEGRITRYVSIRSDITQLMASEQRLAELNRELIRSNQELEQFSFSVSHDLKSPLVTVNGYLMMLKDAIAEGDQEQCTHVIERVDSSTRSMCETIDDLLNLCRIGRIMHSRTDCELAKIVDEVLERFEYQIQGGQAVIKVYPDLPRIWADPVLLRQALQNLISNAIKYGHLPSEPSFIRMSARSDETGVTLQVEDEGPGIDPCQHEKVFAVQPESSGTGIGLTIVRRVMHEHEGRVWIESKLDGGARFLLFFPHAKQHELRIAA